MATKKRGNRPFEIRLTPSERGWLERAAKRRPQTERGGTAPVSRVVHGLIRDAMLERHQDIVKSDDALSETYVVVESIRRKPICACGVGIGALISRSHLLEEHPEAVVDRA